MKNTLLWISLLVTFWVKAQESTRPLFPGFKNIVWINTTEPNWQSSDKLMVVEFWATWCTPCLANLKHLNQLADSLREENVVFVSLTDESPEKIKRFLNTRMIKGFVGCDTGRSIFNKLDINALPRTLIVNAKGKILLDTRPEDLTTSRIRAARMELPSVTPSPIICPGKGSWGPGIDPAFTVHYSMAQGRYPYQRTIRKTIGSGGSGYTCKDQFSGVSMLNHSLSAIISRCLELPGDKRIMNSSSISDTIGWDIIFSDNRFVEPQLYYRQIRDAVCNTFDLCIKDTIYPTGVLVPVRSASQQFMQESSIDFNDPVTKTYRSLGELYQNLEQKGKHIVVYQPEDDTLYIDIFEIFDTYFRMNAEALETWLRTKGITMHAETRSVEHWVIRNREN